MSAHHPVSPVLATAASGLPPFGRLSIRHRCRSRSRWRALAWLTPLALACLATAPSAQAQRPKPKKAGADSSGAVIQVCPVSTGPGPIIAGDSGATVIAPMGSCPPPPPGDSTVWSQPAVTPDGATLSVVPATSSYNYQFLVQNTGNGAAYYDVRASCTGVVTCTRTATIFLGVGGSQSIIVPYQTTGFGTGHITLTATSQSDYSSDDGSVTISVVPAPEDRVYAVDVTPDSARAAVAPNSSLNELFFVTNRGNLTRNFSLAAVCTFAGLPTSCTVSPTSLTALEPNATANVYVWYTSGANGTTGRVQLTARFDSIPGVLDSGWVTLTASTMVAGRPTLNVSGVNPGFAVEPDVCLRIAVGGAAERACGALRVVHALRTVRTLGKARTPMLLYSSAQAQPRPVVAADITMGPGVQLPDSVRAILYRSNGAALDTVRVSGARWRTGTTRRIAFRYDARGDAAGVYDYYVTATNYYGATALSDSARGSLLLVNRSTSEFGSGWWLSGMERLMFVRTDTLLWIGGDGSARIYARRAGSNVYDAPKLDRLDSIVRNDATPDSAYVRYLPHGLRVQFDANGLHRWTVNRLNQRTAFTYSGTRLTRLTVPPAAANKFYTFYYSAAGVLDSVSNPGPGPGSNEVRRRTRTLNAAGQLTAIRDCDGGACASTDTNSVSFGYVTGTGLMRFRGDRRRDTVFFAYDSLYELARDSVPMGAGQTPIVERFRGADSLARWAARGASAVDPDSLYVRVDGARTDVPDITRIWLNKLGAVVRAENALRGVSTVRYDATFPGLAVETRSVLGLLSRAYYDARGRLDSTVVVAPYGTARNAVTRYSWDAKWDFATKIVPPERDSAVMGYDVANGNRLWQQDASGSASRVSYGYYTTGVYAGMLAAIDPPGTEPPDSLYYDVRLGNLRLTRTAMGYQDSLFTDSLGRDTLVVSPVDSAQTKWTRSRTAYSAVDTDTLHTVSGPSESYTATWFSGTVGAQQSTVRTYRDPEGLVDSLHRRSDPDLNGIGWIKTAWKYDRAGRKVKEVAPDGARDSLVYDPAGNVTRWITRRDSAIVSTYDEMNRLRQRVVPGTQYADTTTCLPGGPLCPNFQFPRYRFDGALGVPAVWADTGEGLTVAADLQTFAYDAAGNLRRADNRAARVRRAYYPNGALERDTLMIRDVDPQSSDYGKHVYVLRYGYDLDGRRIWLKHPYVLAPRRYNDAAVYDSTAWSYDAVGRLQRARDPLGNGVTYAYDLLGRPDSIAYPGGIYDKFSYDTDGRQTGRRTVSAADGLLHDDGLSFDARSKITRANALVPGSSSYELTRSWYSGLGQVIATDRNSDVRRYSEGWTPDALGNWYEKRSSSGSGGIRQLQYGYQPGVGRLLNAWKPNEAWEKEDTLMQRHDRAGNVYWDHAIQRVSYSVFHEWPTHSYYSIDQKLVALQRSTSGQQDVGPGVFEEYRYDALGRRVLRRTVHDFWCPSTVQNDSRCFSTVERIVWDGDQVLYEIRYPDGDTVSTASLERDTVTINSVLAPYGRATYTNGPGLDHPVNVIRMGYSLGFASVPEWYRAIALFPHENWRGLGDFGTFDDGAVQRCTFVASTGTTECIDVDWPADPATTFMEAPPTSPQSWFGEVIQQQRDGSSRLYMRNRYYDPTTGRFTQEDPIGLAGGMNLYGFANGDAVNFSDPFGLCPPCTGDGDMSGAFVFAGQLLQPFQRVFEPVALFVANLPTFGMGELAAGGISGEVLELGNTLRTGAGSGILTAAGVAGRVAEATGGTVSQLAKSEGFKVTVTEGKAQIVARIKASGAMRVAVAGKGAMTAAGKLSNDPELTHFESLSSEQLTALVNRARELVRAMRQ